MADPILKTWQATHAVLLDINADGGDTPVVPPYQMLEVDVVDDVAFLRVVKIEEDYQTTTLTRIGETLAVDLRALVYALCSQAGIDIAVLGVK